MINGGLNKLRCALIFLGPFPNGNVSSIRIMSYCKALAKKGIFIKILIIAPTAEAACNEFVSGEIDGVFYQYVTKITWERKNTHILVKLFYYLLGLIKSIRHLKKDKISCLLSYHDELFSNVFYKIVSKILSIPIIIDKTEYPNRYFQNSSMRKKFIHFRLRKFDGYIVITEELRSFYQKISKRGENNIFLLPMTVDPDRYNSLKRKKTESPYIAVVFGSHNRDGLFNSVVAYSKYCQKIDTVPYKLVLIGDFINLCKRFPECQEIQRFIANNNLQDSIVMKGLVPINEIPDFLVNSECLLTTPLKYESGGFPTKLGEYLLSGVPVVATAAGDIPKYLTHERNILMSAPLDLDDVAKNIIFIHKNKAEAHRIAESGKNLAYNVFNAETYIKELIDFLNKFIK